MYMDYYFYLNTLTGVEKNKQLLIFVLFWVIMFIIANILQTIYANKYNDDYIDENDEGNKSKL